MGCFHEGVVQGLPDWLAWAAASAQRLQPHPAQVRPENVPHIEHLADAERHGQERPHPPGLHRLPGALGGIRQQPDHRAAQFVSDSQALVASPVEIDAIHPLFAQNAPSCGPFVGRVHVCHAQSREMGW